MKESPRWLIVMGRHKEALAVLQQAARVNGTSLPPTEDLLAIMKKVQQQVSQRDEREIKVRINKKKTTIRPEANSRFLLI